MLFQLLYPHQLPGVKACQRLLSSLSWFHPRVVPQHPVPTPPRPLHSEPQPLVPPNPRRLELLRGVPPGVLCRANVAQRPRPGPGSPERLRCSRSSIGGHPGRAVLSKGSEVEKVLVLSTFRGAVEGEAHCEAHPWRMSVWMSKTLTCEQKRPDSVGVSWLNAEACDPL